MQYVAVPAPPRAGAASLLASAFTPPDRGLRAVLTGYRATSCGGWALVDACGNVDVIDHGADGDAKFVSAMPFDVQVVEQCSTFGTDTAELRARAEDRLQAILSTAVAHELWTGELASAGATAGDDDWDNNPRLVSNDTTDLTPGGGPVSPAVGVAMIEDALADMLDGTPGAIHCTKGAAAILTTPAGLYRSGDLLLTPTDTRVIADAGYPGTGPDGNQAAAGEWWLYGTAQPTVRLGNPETNQGLDQVARDNTLVIQTDQLAWAAFPCDVVAVRITTN